MTNTKTEKTLCKKLIMIVVPAILTIIMSLSLLSACSKTPPTNNNSDETNAVTDEELIRERVETFISAYNEGDMDTVLECLDAKSRNAMEAMLKLLGGIAGSYTGFEIDLKDLFSL